MMHPYELPALGAGLLLAVAVGVHFGESTIGLINPLHFQGPAVHPRDRGAAIYESPLPARGPAYRDLYGWEEGYAARAADCLDCEALAARDAYAYSATVPYFGSTGEDRARIADRARRTSPYAKLIVPPEEEPADDDRVLRYAHYPVESDEAWEGMGGPEDELDGPDQE